MSSGLYQIVNLENGKKYIGSTNNFDIRFGNHFADLRNNNHDNPHLQRAWNKYGEEIFDKQIIGEFDENELLEREQELLDAYENFDEWDKLYNIAKDADAPMRGVDFSEEHREKISEARKAYFEQNPDAVSGENNPMFGKEVSEERKGKVREKMLGKDNPFYGETHSEEKIVEIIKNQSKVSEQQVVNIRKLAKRGFNNSEIIEELNLDITEANINCIVKGISFDRYGGPIDGEDYERYTYLSDEQIIEIRNKYKNSDITYEKLASDFEIGLEHLGDIINGRERKDCGSPIKGIDYEKNHFEKVRKITVEDVVEIRWRYYKENLTYKEIAESYPVSSGQVSKIIKGSRRKNDPGPIKGKHYSDSKKLKYNSSYLKDLAKVSGNQDEKE